MLVFMDGQAHYDSARIGHKYSTVSTTGCTWSVVPEGRFGNCIKRVSTDNSSAAGELMISPLTTRLGPWSAQKGGVCGFAVKVDNLAAIEVSPAAEFGVFSVFEGPTCHVMVKLNREGTFSLWADGNFEVLLAVSSEGLASGTWHYVEFKWVIDAVSGSFEIRVNGVPVLSFTGDTHERWDFTPSLQVWNAVHLLQVASWPQTFPTPTRVMLTMRMCDLYLADLNSSDPDDVSDFLGDGIVQTILPDGPGASTAWTPSSVPNWDMVNDRPAPDDDGTTVRAITPGLRDTYSFEDIPPTSVVKGVHINILARKEEEGASAVAPIVRQGSIDYVGPTQGVASIAYDRYLTQPYDLNPATGDKFTAAEVNADEFGVQKVF